MIFQIVAVKRSGVTTLYDVISCTASCHVGLPEPFSLSHQAPLVCADGKVLVLTGVQMDEENDEVLNVEVSAVINVNPVY